MSTFDQHTGNHCILKNHKTDTLSPAIMESLDSLSFCNRDVNGSLNNSPLQSNISFHGDDSSTKRTKIHNACKSFLLIDSNEYLKVFSADQFIQKLGCTKKDLKVKVVSIFGNTGDGKSHTLNQTFFDGLEVFRTSSEQNACTIGVWIAFDPNLNIICLDTEGLVGTSTHEDARTRLLLKVLAISDIILYRTRSERLHRDLFYFLGAASETYSYYFQAALQAIGQREGILSSVTALGPSVIIFHETRHTKPLTSGASRSAEDLLLDRFTQMELEIEAFSSIKYVGIQSTNPPTDYQLLRTAIKSELNNTSVRSARKPHLVYSTLKVLNHKFFGEVENVANILFPDQYFTCPVKCFSCGSKCQNSMGHIREGKPHASDGRCRYQHQYENLVYVCKACHNNGNEVVVTSRIQNQNDNSWYGLAKYAWSGYVIECPHCGEIYRSRQHWFGNKNPEDSAVRTEIMHVWNLETPSQGNTTPTTQNTAQRVVDGVSYIKEAVTSVSLQPTKALTAWVADQVAPTYWRPNNEIRYCHKCKALFQSTDTKHHCRSCGEGFCSGCSSRTKCVPTRNWHTPVRVCDDCYDRDTNFNKESFQQEVLPGDDISVRRVSEQLVSTLSVVGTVLTYSKSIIKDTARPSYWVPDSEVLCCCVCEEVFNDFLTLHHCRDCGRGVCQECSQHRKPVPRRGWDNPVRVCNSCVKID